MQLHLSLQCASVHQEIHTKESFPCYFKVDLTMANQLKLANFWGQRRANSSNIWDHFRFKCNEEGEILDKTKAICKHCSAEINYKGGNTSNLLAHVSSYHLSEVEPSGSATLKPKINAVLCGPKMYSKNSTTYSCGSRNLSKGGLMTHKTCGPWQ